MARAKVIRKQDRCFAELPPEFLSAEEIELFPLRDGYYLLSLPLPERAQQKGDAKGARATAEEIAVLHKLQSIKFGERTPENVGKTLSGQEKETLARLEERGWVNVFRGDKYKKGVYNIADKVYPMLRDQGEPGQKQPKAETRGPQAGPAAQPSGALLSKQGYLVIKDQNEAKALSEMLKGDMKSGAVVGTKGFDGSFYVVTRDYFERASNAILAALGNGSDAETIAGSCKFDVDGVRAVLQQLAESGEVIEKRKGVFAAV